MLGAATSACTENLGAPAGTDMETSHDLGEDMSEVEDHQRQIGESCAGPEDCIEGALCIGDSNQDYRCMPICDEPYSLCADASVCLALAGRPEAVCYLGGSLEVTSPCRSNLECVSGSLCIGGSEEFYCLNACDATPMCETGKSCNALSTGARICSTNLGSLCADTSECPDSLECSVEVEGLEALFPGVCTSRCPCDDSGVCLQLPQTGAESCYPECKTDSDCRYLSGWRCQDSGACDGFDDPDECAMRVGQRRVCLPVPQ